MATRGFSMHISTGSYRTPGCCASCCGPRETELEARATEKHGNIRTTLTMRFPYCNACSARARKEKVRAVIVLLAAAAFGAAFAAGAWFGEDYVDGAIGFSVALPIAALVAFLLALVTRPGLPPPPATARGEAVILRDTSGTILCTNQQFAELMARANNTSMRPDSQWMTTEAWAPLTALLLGAFVLIFWLKTPSHPTYSAPATRAPTTRAPTPPPPPVSRPPSKPH